LLVRGEMPQAGSAAAKDFDLFGPEYSALNGAGDPGTHFSVTDASGSRIRRLYSGTIHLRNPASAGSGNPA
jgi:hypothetical protein